MDHDLRWIRGQIAGFGERGPGFRYPEEFRRRVARYAERRLQVTTTGTVAREVGIPWVTIRRWRARADDQATWQVERTPSSMVPVHVSDVVQATMMDTASEGLTVVTPKGWRIEGLTVDQACEVLGRLS